jgi:hypothetical protein
MMQRWPGHQARKAAVRALLLHASFGVFHPRVLATRCLEPQLELMK